MSHPEIEYGILEPPDEIVRNRSTLLKGWCFRRDHGPIEGIRAQIDKRVFKGRRKQRRVEVADRFPDFPKADRSGFSIELELPRGRSYVRLFYRDETGTWIEFGSVALRRPWLQTPWSRSGNDEYQDWIRRNDTLSPEDIRLISAHIGRFSERPKFTVIIPGSGEIPKPTQASLRAQLYPDWEVQRSLEITSTDAFVFVEPGDTLSPHALYLIAYEMINYPDSSVFYSDFDHIDEKGSRCEPYFKPDWDPDLQRSSNYIQFVTAYRGSALAPYSENFRGTRDLALRVTETLREDQIRHLPWILYHHTTTAAEAPIQSGAEAVQDQLNRLGFDAIAESTDSGVVRVRYALPDNPPLVSLIIPTRNRRELLEKCVVSLLDRTIYPSFELLIIDNGSDEADALEYLAKLNRRPNVRVLRYQGRFNYSAINNFAVKQSKGQVLALVNNDIEATTPDWLGEMVALALRPDVGAVGAKLLYPDGSIQHAGVYVGCRGTAAHLFCGLPGNHGGPGNRANLLQRMTAVTAACLVVQRERYEEVGGLDETDFEVSFNDVDFCLKLYQAGYRNIFTPYATLIHHESASRGKHRSGPSKQLGDLEGDRLYYKWRHFTLSDPAYNPNLTLEEQDYSPALHSRVQAPWKTA
jgi:GT2 family glycosyltransferase